MRRKTDEEFKQEVYDLVGDTYTVLDSYVNTRTKLRVKHNKCGNVYSVAPSKFLTGRRCPYCAGLINKTDKQFKQEVYDQVGKGYAFLDSYVNAYTKLRVKHNNCNRVYSVAPTNFLRGSRCPYCNGNAKKTNEQFKQEIYDLVGNEYVFLEDYQGTDTKIKVKHNKCGNTYKVTPDNFINGKRCLYCYVEDRRKTNEEFKQEVYNLVGNNYTFLDNYVNNQIKLKVKHNKCGNAYEVTPNSFLQGNRCPYCNSPKGELIIDKILKSLNINYEAQKTFDDLKDKSYLSYDFYIPDQNILIEYQGLQHYEPIEYFGGKDRFKVQQKHDQMKLDYAKENGYRLIDVPYTEDNFYKINKYLIKHGLK